MTQPDAIFFGPTGDPRIDPLLSGFGTRWAGVDPTLTFSVQSPTSTYVQNYSEIDEPARGAQFTVPEDAEASFRASLEAWSAVANVTLVEITDSAAQSGDLRLGVTNALQFLDPDVSDDLILIGLPRPPSDEASGGDAWIAPSALDLNYQISPEGEGNLLLLQLAGDLLADLNSDPFTTPGISGTVLGPEFNDLAFTIFAFNQAFNEQPDPDNPEVTIPQPDFPTTPMLLDILAIQSIYGPDFTTNAGNTVYQFGPGVPLFQTIWDGGGVDTIDWTNQALPAFVDLTPGSFSHLGPERFNGTAFVPETVAIAFGTIIENFNGGPLADTVVGNDAANLVFGGPDNDLIEGRNGADVLYGNTQNDTIYGNVDNDILFGGQNEDLLYGGQGFDAVYGNFGFDILYGNLANDALFGGQEGDVLYGGQGEDSLFGNKGNDTLFGNKGLDLLDGGPGADILVGGSENDTLRGGLDDDNLSGGSGVDSLEGGDGSDVLDGGDDGDLMRGDNGDDILTGGGGNDTLYGGAGFDELSGGDLDDILYGGEGDDVLDGGANDDALYGGEGNDVIEGGAGADFIDAGGGADEMNGGTGNDTFIVSDTEQSVSDDGGFDVVQTLVAFELPDGIENGFITGPNATPLIGNGLDNGLVGNARDNLLSGEGGNDSLFGGGGSDTLDGGDGFDVLDGGDGDDVYIIDASAADTIVEGAAAGLDIVLTEGSFTLQENIEILQVFGMLDAEATGNGSDNTIIGGIGNNLLSGAAGNDSLDGGTGADTLFGDTGDDFLLGGGGLDIFAFSGGNTGGDTIGDYTPGQDQIDLIGLTEIGQTQNGSDVELALSNGDTVTILGITVGDITFVMP